MSTLMSPSGTTSASWPLWSTRVRLVVTDAAALESARAVCESVLSRVDHAANRFNPRSEISRLTGGMTAAPVSELFAELVGEACDAAEWTAGAVDPTVGAALADNGYDRDIRVVRIEGATPRAVIRRTPAWRHVHVGRRSVKLPAGIQLDLGATAKASAADRCAHQVAESLGIGVLVSIGGDLATAGPAPRSGWQVRVQDGTAEPIAQVRLESGGALATSSTLHRTWRQGDEARHHIIDPATGSPARPHWRTVSVAAPTCLQANIASTAAVVKGAAGADWLRFPARLVAWDCTVLTLNGWPADQA
jgi:thiamine biosynthesis lipoprotein